MEQHRTECEDEMLDEVASVPEAPVAEPETKIEAEAVSVSAPVAQEPKPVRKRALRKSTRKD